MALNSDSISFHGKFFGVGFEKITSRVFRCLLFIIYTSTANLQVKSNLASLDVHTLRKYAISGSVFPLRSQDAFQATRSFGERMLFTLQFDMNHLAFLVTVSLSLFFVLAALATPLLAAVTESAYLLHRKSFYDKCALQITQAAFCMGIFIFVTLGGIGLLYSIFTVRQEMAELAAAVAMSGASAGLLAQLREYLGPTPLLFLLPIMGIFLLCLYWGTWSALKNYRALHHILGWAAALFMLGVLFFGLLLAANSPSPMLPAFFPGNALPALLADFFSSPPLPLFYLSLTCTGLAAGAGLSQLWLFMRRYNDDYGRDYYTFAMRYCARMALIFTLASVLIGGALALLLYYSIPPEFTQPPNIGLTLIAFGLPLSCCLLWSGIAKSENPLRHKPGAIFACVFLFIAICAQLLALTNSFPLY